VCDGIEGPSVGDHAAAFWKTVVRLVLLLVGAMYIYLEFVGVLLYSRRTFRSRLTTHKAGTAALSLSLSPS
jgi:hypothetical protein